MTWIASSTLLPHIPGFLCSSQVRRLSLQEFSWHLWILFGPGKTRPAVKRPLSKAWLTCSRLIITPSAKGQRRTLATLRALPSYFCSSMIMIPTVLHSLVHPLLTLSTPLVLRTRFMIGSQISPTTSALTKLLASSTAVLVKLPLETILRRGQVAVLSSQPYLQALDAKETRVDAVVPLGRYKGVMGTVYHIMNEEGAREIPVKPAATKKGKAKAKSVSTVSRQGQGPQGLWRGWKVNWWGLVGLWMATVVGAGGEGEF